MKKSRKLIPIIAVLLISLFVFGSCGLPDSSGLPDLGSYMGTQDVTTNRRYNSIVATTDGWIAAGRLLELPNNAVIAKYDKQGDIVWEKAFGGSDATEFVSVIELDDGYVATTRFYTFDGDLTGSDKSKQGNAYHIAAKYDKNGERIWIKNLAAGINNLSNGFLPEATLIANSTGFLSVYSINIGGTCINNAVQFSADGDTIWSKDINEQLEPYPDTDRLRIVKILRSPHGLLLFGRSERHVWGFDWEDGPSFIAFMGEDGTVDSQKAIPMGEISSGWNSHMIDDVSIAPDGIIIIGSNPNAEAPCIKKFDFEMNLIWETPYIQDSWIDFSKVAAVGEFVFILGQSWGESDKWFILGLNASGEIYGIEKYGKTEEGTICDINIFNYDEHLVVYQCIQYMQSSDESKIRFLFYDKNPLV